MPDGFMAFAICARCDAAPLCKSFGRCICQRPVDPHKDDIANRAEGAGSSHAYQDATPTVVSKSK